MSLLNEKIDELIWGYLSKNPNKDDYLQYIEYDKESLSLCQLSEPDENGFFLWSPQPMESIEFTSIEQIHALTISEKAKTLYSSYWCHSFECDYLEHSIFINLCANQQELEELKNSIIFNIENSSKLNGQILLPIAYTDSDYFFALDNDTEEIYLVELNGKTNRVSQNIESFINDVE